MHQPAVPIRRAMSWPTWKQRLQMACHNRMRLVARFHDAHVPFFVLDTIFDAQFEKKYIPGCVLKNNSIDKSQKNHYFLFYILRLHKSMTKLISVLAIDCSCSPPAIPCELKIYIPKIACLVQNAFLQLYYKGCQIAICCLLCARIYVYPWLSFRPSIYNYRGRRLQRVLQN